MKEIGFETVPVGWAWYAVLEEYNYPLHYLHMSDWNHPSLKGSYLMACVIYSVVFQESTVDIPYHGTEIMKTENLSETVFIFANLLSVTEL